MIYLIMAFIKRRVEYAINYRLEVIDKENQNSFRVIYGESDEFPGLTVDKFNDILVKQKYYHSELRREKEEYL